MDSPTKLVRLRQPDAIEDPLIVSAHGWSICVTPSILSAEFAVISAPNAFGKGSDDGKNYPKGFDRFWTFDYVKRTRPVGECQSILFFYDEPRGQIQQ